MNYIDFFQKDTLNTQIIDGYTYNAIQQLDLVYPPYNKIALAEVNNTYHEQCHIFKSNIYKSYKFKDESKAGSIPEKLKTICYDQFEKNISFQEYLESQLFYKAVYYCFYDQIAYFGTGENKDVNKIYALSPKYIYPNRNKTEFWQILPNTNFARETLKTLITAPESQINYAKANTQFLAFKTSTNSEQQELYEFSGKSSRSDYFPNIPYIPAMEGMETNRLIGSYDKSWLLQGSEFRNILHLTGLDPNNDEDKIIIDDYRKDVNNVKNSGRILILATPRNDSTIKFDKPEHNQKEDYSDTKLINRDEIISANGLNATVLGIKTDDSSLTSTSQKEAINLFVQTQILNEKTIIEQHYDRLFKVIDPSYDTNLELVPLSFEDDKEKADISKIDSETLKSYVEIGDLKLVNEFRRKNNLEELVDKQWKEIKENFATGGIDFNV